jgi:hypothetical protein
MNFAVVIGLMHRTSWFMFNSDLQAEDSNLDLDYEYPD